MLRLLAIPIELLRIAFYALQGLVDALRARDRLSLEFSVLVNAPRDAVWRFSTAERMVLDGPPVLEISREPIPDADDLWLTRVSVSGQPRAQAVTRELVRDEAQGVLVAQAVPHALSVPPEGGRNVKSEMRVTATAQGTSLTVFNEMTVRSFRDRIIYPLSLRRMAHLIKQQCEAEAGTQSRAAVLANHGLVLSAVAFLSFCYLFGWKEGLLLSIVVVLHELGHAAAMLMCGVGVRGIYLIPFFGGAAVPKTAYGSEDRLGFVALMGPGFSLIPTLGLFAMSPSSGGTDLSHAAQMFAIINAANLLPIYPLDGGQILNALIGSVNQRVAQVASWLGLLAGLGLAVEFESLLIGVPFLLFALQRYLSGNRTAQLEPLSFAGGLALAVASVATFALYVYVVIKTGGT
ncbi:metalloprotease [Bradyrhizobium sp. Cp5.3]|uniref:metalloprotease n=1 Tax=Bradyrhizobium sp. Cp5.3 TaxID=443598 RepID=UPI0003FBBFD0|nr:site-2 protease family protein [Bradyrhizobium sp. Cp5.3]